MGKRYIKRFRSRLPKVAEKIAMVKDTSDSKVTTAVHTVIKYFNREAYKYIGPGCVNRPDERLAIVVILAVGNDRTELEKEIDGKPDNTDEMLCGLSLPDRAAFCLEIPPRKSYLPLTLVDWKPFCF